jgi:hypothetical protein
MRTHERVVVVGEYAWGNCQDRDARWPGYPRERSAS